MITVPHRLLILSTVSVHHQGADCVVLTKRLTKPQHERPSYTKLHVLSIVRAGRQHIITEEGHAYHVHAGQAMLLRRGLYTVTDLLPAAGQAFCADLVFFTGRGINPSDDTADKSNGSFAYDSDLLPTGPEAIRNLLAQQPGARPFYLGGLHHGQPRLRTTLGLGS
ncbi:hypothetical protein [Neolewinella sp.]|uniref:hypothetical protein n=1 Tax=Neolewinella sp. TaxID=2993543 RepID=UPI003B526157